MRQTCVIGTRGSKLALWQAHTVQKLLQTAFPDVDVEVQTVSTTGDRVVDTPLEKMGNQGIFTKELERALIDGAVDICVHSVKDMAAELPKDCVMGAVLPRADVRDVLVCGPRLTDVHRLEDVPQGARLGTGSLRRMAQLRANFPQIEPKTIRGNVDTRLEKAMGSDYEGAILAAAGVIRMGRANDITAFIPIDQMVPAAGQGAIGLEIRRGDKRIAAMCAAVNDPTTFACVAGERRVMYELEGGCQVPIGAYAHMEGDATVFDAIVLSLDGTRTARSHREADASTSPIELARMVLDDLHAQGADDILASVRAAGFRAASVRTSDVQPAGDSQ